MKLIINNFGTRGYMYNMNYKILTKFLKLDQNLQECEGMIGSESEYQWNLNLRTKET